MLTASDITYAHAKTLEKKFLKRQPDLGQVTLPRKLAGQVRLEIWMLPGHHHYTFQCAHTHTHTHTHTCPIQATLTPTNSTRQSLLSDPVCYTPTTRNRVAQDKHPKGKDPVPVVALGLLGRLLRKRIKLFKMEITEKYRRIRQC